MMKNKKYQLAAWTRSSENGLEIRMIPSLHHEMQESYIKEIARCHKMKEEGHDVSERLMRAFEKNADITETDSDISARQHSTASIRTTMHGTAGILTSDPTCIFLEDSVTTSSDFAENSSVWRKNTEGVTSSSNLNQSIFWKSTMSRLRRIAICAPICTR